MLCGTAGLRTGHQLGVAVPPVDMPRCQAEKGQCPTRGRVPSASCYGPGHCMPSPESPRAAPTKDRTETSRPPHMLLHWHTKLSACNQDKTIRADNEWSHQSGSLARKQGKPFCGIPVPAAQLVVCRRVGCLGSRLPALPPSSKVLRRKGKISEGNKSLGKLPGWVFLAAFALHSGGGRASEEDALSLLPTGGHQHYINSQ